MKNNIYIEESLLNTEQSCYKNKRSNSQNTDNSKQTSSKSSSSSRSKYLGGSKLMKSTIF